MTSMAASASQEHASPATRSPLSRPAINLVEHGKESYNDDDDGDNADETYEGGKYNYDSEDNGDNVEDDYDFTSSTDADKEDLLPNEGLGATTAAGAAEENYFPRIEAIFYSIFHPTKGPSVIYQVPEGSIYTTPAPQQQQQQQPDTTDDHANNGASAATAPSTATADAEEARTHTHTPLFDFKSLSEYIIPRAPLCGRLITYSTTSHGGQTYKIVSHPVLIVDQQKYPRNSFIFNLAFVFDGRADVRAYEPVVRKCARELKDLEQNSSFLSRSQFRMYEVIEQLFEDLNSYFESFVALPDAPHTKYVLEAAKATELLRDKRIFSPPSSSTAKMGHDAASNVAMGKRAASGAGAQMQQQQRPGTGSSSGSATAKELTSLRLDGIAALLSDDDNGAAAISPRTTRPAPLRRASTDTTLMMTSTSPTSGTPSDSTPASPSSRKSDKRKDSAGSSAGGGGGVAMRPTVNRSKTFAALGISGTTVTTTNTSTGTLAASAATTTDDNESGVRRTSGNQLPFSAVSMSRTSSGAGRDGSTGAATTTRRNGGDGQVGAAAPAAMLAPGKREPPHGLGRTVRDAINVKLFPTYTNPKEVHDWDVPVTLLDLRPRVSDNWDLTMRKVLPFVDGINHVRRIAQLADADLELTRQCVEHLLYYRCIILIDTFQFTNLYTVRPTIATLAEDEMIINECASYVTRHGFAMPSWPKLLELYSSLRPSVTLNEWIEDNDIDGLGIDVRRFVTFGVIKGFLRRLHRFPVLLVGEAAEQLERMMMAANKGAAATPSAAAARDPSPLSMKVPGDRGNSGSRDRNRVAQMRAEEASMPSSSSSPSSSRRGRQETSDDQGWANVFAPSTAQTAASSSSRETAVGGHGSSKRQQQPTHGQLGVASQPRKTRGATVMDVANVAFDMADKDRAAEQAAAASTSSATPASTSTATRISIRTPTQRGMSSSTIRPGGQSRNDSSFDDDYRQGGGGAGGSSSRGGGGGGVSAFSNFTAASPSSTIQVPAGFVDMLDGTYPDDAFCVRFGRNWNEILRILIYVGVQGGGGTTAAGQTLSTTQLPASSSSATLNVRRGRLSTHDGGGGGDGDGAGDESTFGHMSGIWGVGGGAGAGASATPSRRRSSTQTQQAAGTTAAAPAVTAFPSLPRFRQSSQNGTGQSTAGYSRYGAAASQQQQSDGGGGGGGGGGWSSRASTSVVMPLADDLGYDDRQRLKRGDLGRIQLIVK